MDSAIALEDDVSIAKKNSFDHFHRFATCVAAMKIKCNLCSAILQECDIRRFKKEFEDLGYLLICTNWIGCTQCSTHQSRTPEKMFICECCVCLKKGKETDAVIFHHSKRNIHFFESSDTKIALNVVMMS